MSKSQPNDEPITLPLRDVALCVADHVAAALAELRHSLSKHMRVYRVGVVELPVARENYNVLADCLILCRNLA